MTRPFVFISYSHEDEAEKDQLLAHLEVLQHAGLIEVWSDDRIGIGTDWQAEINQSIAQARVAILFVTANFLTSDFILGQEVPAMLQRQEQEGLIILPVIAKPCAWQRVDWLARLVPPRTRPIWHGPDSEVDEALATIAEQVARIINNEPFSTEPQPPPEDKNNAKKQLQIGSLTLPISPLPALAISLLSLLGLAFALYFLFVPTPPAPPTPGPLPVQAGLFNVLLAEFGQENPAGELQPSPVGQQISQRIYQSLQLEFENLPVSLRQDFQPVIWHDTLNPLPNGGEIGLIADEKAAMELATDLGADLIIYGNLNQTDDGARFVPSFYVASLKGQAEEIVGEHRLGDPIPLQSPELQNPQAALALNRQLNDRVTALARFTLGLMYDLGGSHQEALEVFQQAVDELDWDENSGQEVFYYFLGRSALFLKEDEEAQAAFEEALDLTDNRYVRAYIGLGSVHFRRAQCRLFSMADSPGAQYDDLCRQDEGDYLASCPPDSPDCQNLIQQELEQTLANYQRVIDESLEAQIKITARLSLGIAHRLQGEIAYVEGRHEEADALFDIAIEELRAILTPLDAAGQHRYLAQAYQSLGAAYAQQAQIRQIRGDTEGSLTLYQQARAAFADCAAQQNESLFDETLAEQIVARCQQADETVSNIISSLEGEEQ